MSLGIAFKGPEGIVLAADSRVTLTASQDAGDGRVQLLPATFDNATKLLHARGQPNVGAVTYGLGAFLGSDPRTAHSLMSEFEKEELGDGESRLKTDEFSRRLGAFFNRQWTERMPGGAGAQDMLFLVGGYDEGEVYGRVYQVTIPSHPEPVEQTPGEFGLSWGGQIEFTNRLIHGFDPRLLGVLKEQLELEDGELDNLAQVLRQTLNVGIPYQFLPLQDCVDLSILLIRTTANLQKFQVAQRGVGGAIDVATITREDGFRPVQQKKVSGEGGL